MVGGVVEGRRCGKTRQVALPTAPLDTIGPDAGTVECRTWNTSPRYACVPRDYKSNVNTSSDCRHHLSPSIESIFTETDFRLMISNICARTENNDVL